MTQGDLSRVCVEVRQRALTSWVASVAEMYNLQFWRMEVQIQDGKVKGPHLRWSHLTHSQALEATRQSVTFLGLWMKVLLSVFIPMPLRFPPYTVHFQLVACSTPGHFSVNIDSSCDFEEMSPPHKLSLMRKS